MRLLRTRAEKDALNLGLKGLTGRTKKVPGYGVFFKVQTSCSQWPKWVMQTILPHLLSENQLPYTAFVTDKNTVFLAGYFNISAQTQIHQHT